MFPKADYPNAIFQYGDDDMQHAFYDGKIFKDGNMVDKPPVVKVMNKSCVKSVLKSNKSIYHDWMLLKVVLQHNLRKGKILRNYRISTKLYLLK